MDDAALAVAEDLHFDMPRLREEALKIKRAVAEEGLSLGLGDRKDRIELAAVARHAHTATTTASRRLDKDRITDAGGLLARMIELQNGLAAGHHRDAQFPRSSLCHDFVAHQPDVLGRWADEDEVMFADDLRELGILGEKPEPWVNGIRTSDRCRRKDRRNVEVALSRRRRADAHAFIGKSHVHGVGVGGRMHRDSTNAHLATGAMDA